jgi:thiamine biosynthesis lipoprotein
MPDFQHVMAGWDRQVSGTAVHPDHLVHVEFIWGTAITLDLRGIEGRIDEALGAVARCCAWFVEVDERFSPFRALSEVTAARNDIAVPGFPSPDFIEVQRACQQARMLTRGAFDPWRVRGGYDPSGYVKGWAAGRAGCLLAEAGFADHMVNAGGDIVCAGDRDPGSELGWPIGIVNPHRTSEVVAVVDVRNAAVATSGRYERGDHVVDPVTGRPARAADSATVVGPDAGLADAAASAVLVAGPACMAWFPQLGPHWSVHLVVGEVEHRYGPAFDED